MEMGVRIEQFAREFTDKVQKRPVQSKQLPQSQIQAFPKLVSEYKINPDTLEVTQASEVSRLDQATERKLMR